jgi:NAD(P)-dependent dehydrogenase (short-subunit alcohol dehydrogenase family)
MSKLAESVVVVTGASSGLGKALALELAGRHASLVLAARRGDALEDTAEQCRQRGAQATVVATDVTSEAEVQALARAALDAFGRIDVWINNAGVTLFASLEATAFEEHRRVIETNLFGAMYGARAVLPVFRRQHRGVLIDVGSVLSEVGHAFVPSYVISKFGVRGLTEALRVALADEPDIHVCTVLPYTIDTPHFEVAANRTQREARALPPMQSPEKVARAIANVAERPRRVRFVPRSLVLGIALHALAPRASERLLLDALRRFHLTEGGEEPTSGNLNEPPREVAKVHGQRPPTVSTTRFFAWAALRFVRIELARARRWLARRWHVEAPA